MKACKPEIRYHKASFPDTSWVLQAWDAPDAEDITLNGTLKSANCGILVRISASTTHIAAYYAKAVNYTLMITAVSFLQVIRLFL